MKKLRLLLALFLVSISVQGFCADRIAPELPDAVTLESGQSYYLYNVLEGKFLCRSSTNTSYPGLGTYGEKVTITDTGEGEYTIQFASNNYYFEGYDTYISSYSTKRSNYYWFNIAESDKGYTIQRSAKNKNYYKADEFIGYNGSNGDRLNPALSEGSIHWQLMAVDEAEYYFAKHKLYSILNLADTYNFYVDQYERVYNDLTSTTAVLNQAQETLNDALAMSKYYVSPSWTDYPILFQNLTENKWTNNGNDGLYWQFRPDGTVKTSILKGTVDVDQDATLVFTYNHSSYNNSLRVYLDGELVQTVVHNQGSSKRRYYVEMGYGKHDVAWEFVSNDARNNTGSNNYNYLREIGVVKTPTITPATTTVEGQLGTEVLKLVDPVSSVKKIVINGVIGAKDWTTIGMMVNAFSIDMSGATATAPIPASLFTKSKLPFLHSVKLPQGITAIGNQAFYGSDIEDEMVFPSSLKTIGEYAFYNSKLKAAYMADGITSIGYYAFNSCVFLENVTFPSTTEIIPGRCFEYCANLRTFEIPEGVKEIGECAFHNASQFNPRFPASMRRIGDEAFYGTATDCLYISEDMVVQDHAFSNCNNLVYAEWPTSFAEAKSSNSTNDNSPVVSNCPKLKDVYLKSPTMVVQTGTNGSNFFAGNTLGNITLHVPDFLETTYKLDPYWYKCNVVPFNSSDITDWYIKRPLNLNDGQRMGGTPSLHVSAAGRFTISGDTPQDIGDLSINFGNFRYYSNEYNGTQWGFMLSSTDKVNITGELSENVYTDANTWRFITLPFDTKVADITNYDLTDGQPTSYAIRYYDGASRAANGTGSNWKNYAKDDVIPAGTGFIYQTAKNACTKFVAQNNASKQYILSNKEFVKSLEVNASEVTANKGWNLVGNPWQTYYNIHKLNFTAPITVWNSSSSKYVAYSVIDDDYAIEPLQALFVQCPDELHTISFPIDGRQLTTKIESQNGARAKEAPARKLIDVELSDGQLSDKTRFVMNPQAKLEYETTCDASKFMSMDAAVPQIYTIENETPMAINERPFGDGTVKLGIKVAAGGQYTISAPRNQFQNIVLVDSETGTETNLASGSYAFAANAGTHDGRFMLRVGGTMVTEIANVKKNDAQPDHYFNLNGQKVDAPAKGVYVVNGKKVIFK